MTNPTATLTISKISKRDDAGWCHGQVGPLSFQAKVYDEPSQYGYNEGRISKLWLSTAPKNGTVVYNFDRGEDFCDLPVAYLDAIVAAIEAATA